MMIATRHSLSYLDPRHWWQRLLTVFYKRREFDYKHQYCHEGCRIFDIHVRFDEHRRPYVCQGWFMTYDLSEEGLMQVLDWVNGQGDCGCIVTLETTRAYYIQPETLRRQEECFCQWCSELTRVYHQIHFIGGQSRMSGKVIYEFPTNQGEDKFNIVGDIVFK